MENKSFEDKNGWNIFQRIYKKRTKVEVKYTEIILFWFENESNKSLNSLHNLFREHGIQSEKIIIETHPRGRYLTYPFVREFKTTLEMPRRYPFIEIAEPFNQS